MKRRELIKTLEQNGFAFSRNGSRHDIYKKEKIRIAVPRHSEIEEFLVKQILKEADIKEK